MLTTASWIVVGAVGSFLDLGIDEVLGYAGSLIDTLGLKNIIIGFGVVALVGAIISRFFNKG